MVTKNRLFFILRFIVSFGLIFALLWIVRNDVKNIASIIVNSNKIFFVSAFLLSYVITFGLSVRLKLLMAGQKIWLPIKDLIYLTFIGFFFNNFLPTSIGGDIVKAYYASKKTNNKTASYAAVLFDRFMGFFSALSLAVIGIIFIGGDLDNKRIAAFIFIMLGVAALLILLLLNRKIARFLLPPFFKSGVLSSVKEKISKLYNAVNFYRHSFGVLIKTYFLALLLQGFSVLGVYLFISCLGGEISILKLFLVIPIVWIVSMLPSLNGLGVREGAFVYLLKGDIGTEMAFAVSLLWLSTIISFSIVGGALHLFFPLKMKVD